MRAQVALLLRAGLRLSRPAFTMQEGYALNAVALGVAVRARLLVTATFVALGLDHTIATAWTASSAWALRSRCCVV